MNKHLRILIMAGVCLSVVNAAHAQGMIPRRPAPAKEFYDALKAAARDELPKDLGLLKVEKVLLYSCGGEEDLGVLERRDWLSFLAFQMVHMEWILSGNFNEVSWRTELATVEKKLFDAVMRGEQLRMEDFRSFAYGLANRLNRESPRGSDWLEPVLDGCGAGPETLVQFAVPAGEHAQYMEATIFTVCQGEADVPPDLCSWTDYVGGTMLGGTITARLAGHDEVWTFPIHKMPAPEDESQPLIIPLPPDSTGCEDCE